MSTKLPKAQANIAKDQNLDQIKKNENKSTKSAYLTSALGTSLKLLLYLNALLLLWRTLVIDLVWLLPRQPFTGGLLGIIFPRLVTLNCPKWLYTLVSPLFDGDATPTILAVSYLCLFYSGFKFTLFLKRFQKRVSNSSRRKNFCLTTFVLVIILFVSPVSWIGRIIASEINHYNMVSESSWLFNGPDEQQQDLRQSERFFNVFDHMLNKQYHPETLAPDFTFPYKNIPLDTLQHCEDSLFPGDSAYPETRERFYKTGKLELDVYVPKTIKNQTKLSKKPGIVLHLHGGGWEKGHRHFLSMNYHGGVPHSILEENFIVSVSYRLTCSGIDGPELLNDVLDAARFVQKNAASWGADPNKIVPWGTSAGGTLALLLGYRHGTELPIKGIINFYGVTELREKEIKKLSGNPYETWFSGIFVAATRHLCDTSDNKHQTIEQKEQCFEDFSPLAHVDQHSPPTLTIHGEQDGVVLINQAYKLQEKLQANNVTEATVIVQGVHDCDVFSSSLCAQAAVIAVNKFLDHVF